MSLKMQGNFNLFYIYFKNYKNLIYIIYIYKFLISNYKTKISKQLKYYIFHFYK